MRLLRVFARRSTAAAALLGFSAGVVKDPVGDLLKAWATDTKVDLTGIGLLGLVGLPYALKFLWAWVFDRYRLPWLGRRRGWLVVTQLGLAAAIGAMAFGDPGRSLATLAGLALIVAFVGACQDILIDAWRSDAFDEADAAWGSSLYVAGYRLATVVTGSLAFALADHLPWRGVYGLVAASLGVGVLGTVLAREPQVAAPSSARVALVAPLSEFIHRGRRTTAQLALLFVALYKLPDQLAAGMTVRFLQETGYDKSTFGAIRGGIGLGASIGFAVLGGAAVTVLGINRSLWLFWGAMCASNAGFMLLAGQPPDRGRLAAVIVVENACGGLVTAAFMGYLVMLCDRRFSAMQFALLTSLMSLVGYGVSPLSALLARELGWNAFFLATIVAGLPGFALLPLVAPWSAMRPAGARVADATTPG